VVGALLIAAQVAAAQPTDSTYASASLRAVVDRAATANRNVPATLMAYRAHLETEMALIIVDTLGRERTGQIEQMGGTGRWSPDSGFVANIQGYRMQSTGVPVSMAGMARNWAIPYLYGQRLLLGVSFASPPEEQRPGRRLDPKRPDSIRAVHPFADDRDRYYRFTGGDTVGTVTTATRRVPIVRILVHPRRELSANFAAFDGEVDIDAVRHEIIRMRGRFVVSQQMSRIRGLSGIFIKASGLVGVAFGEFENADHMGRYWLPTTQRVELVSANNFAPGLRFAFRTMTRFSDYELEEAAPVAARTISPRRRTIFAPPDSLERFRDWRSELGSASASISTTDFDDIAPPIWRTDGPPRVTLFGSRVDRTVHFNRIEGLYTGAHGALEFRDLAPGTVGRAWAGWAWSEQTVRGGASLSRNWSRSSTAIVGERRLVGTQDFLRDFADLGVSFASLVASTEELDWVDRTSVSLAHVRVIKSIDNGLFTMRASAARDRDVAANLVHSPIARRRSYLPNRHARNGSYALGALSYEFHPNVSGALLEPGLGATASVEGAAGDLEWVRAEVSTSARRYFGPVTFAVRADAGAVLSDDPPPQTLFELGGVSARLTGYEYKEFAGDRAVVARVYTNYGFPIWRAPRRLGRLLLPGLSPGLAAGVDAGWTRLSSDAARASVLEMGDGLTPVSRETGGIRSTVFAGVTFLATAVHIGFARPIDHSAPWRFTFRLGQGF
jgi:hypothetical protein